MYVRDRPLGMIIFFFSVVVVVEVLVVVVVRGTIVNRTKYC